MSETPTIPAPARTPAAFLPILAGTSLFLLYQYILAVLRLTNSARNMDNKFSSIARDEFLGFLVAENAFVIIAYLILAIAGAFLIQPFASRISRTLQITRRRWIILISLALAALLHEYFTLRLVDSRPYFLQDAASGHWYYHLLDFVPSSLRKGTDFLLFTVLPLALLATAIIWRIHLHRRRGWITAAILFTLGGTAFGLLQLRKSGGGNLDRTANVPNILIIGSDSLRGDRLGFAGYRPARSDGPAAAGVSPAIDALASRSIVFENCYAPIGSTLESGTSLMSSLYPHTHGLRHMFPNQETLRAANQKVVPLATLLREKGYDTAAIGDWCAGYYDLMPLGFEHISVSSFDNFKIYMSQAVLMAHFVVPLYFDNPLGYRLFPQISSFAQFVTPNVVTNRVRDRLSGVSSSGRPFFWHVFYSCTHLPYRSTEPYASMFADPAYNGPNKTAVNFPIDAFTSSRTLEQTLAAASPEDIAQINALYDSCVRQFDSCVQNILDALKENGLSGNTIVVITGDHGDDLYEPGVTLLHGQTFNGGLQGSRIPMVVHVPGRKPAAIPQTVRLIDLIPTLADMTGVEKPDSWEGQSFAGWIDGTQPPEWRPFYGETGFPFMQAKVGGVIRPPLMPMDEMTFIDPSFNYQFVLKDEYDTSLIQAKQRCLATRFWKVVCTPAADGSRHFGLFHLPSDPHSRTDLSASRPEVLEPLRNALNRWIDHHHESSISEIFPSGEPQ